jgi:hypothetical protein
MSEEKQPTSYDEAVTMFRQRFNEEMAKQVNAYDGSKLAAHIIERLNQDRHKVIWKLLGLDDKWGKLEVDHCNNRQSNLTEMLSDSVREEVTKWLEEVTREVIAANREKLKGQFRKAFTEELWRLGEWNATTEARNSAEGILKKIRAETEKEFMEGVRNARVEEAQREGPAGQADQA